MKQAILLALVLCLAAAPALAQEPSPPPASGGGGSPWGGSGGGGSTWPARQPFPIPSNDPGPGLLTSEYMWAGSEKLQYDGIYQLTTATWTVNKALFVINDSLAQFRLAIIGSFDRVLSVVAPALLPVVRKMLLLGVLIGAVAYLLHGVVQFQLASMRRAVLLALTLPTLFVSLGLTFASVEGMRFAMARELSSVVFDAAAADLGTDMTLDDQSSNRLADIAAWYLMIERSDVVVVDDALPERFTASFYTQPPTDWSTIGAESRSAYITQANQGLRQMLFGLVPAALMVLDAVLQALWTLILGLLFLFFALALTFAVFGPFAREAYQLFTMIFNLVVGSWVISSVQGLLVAYLVSLAASGNMLGVFAMSLFVLGVHGAFILAVGGVLLIKALMMSGAVLMPDAPDAVNRSLRRVGGAVVGGAVGGLVGGLAVVNGVDNGLKSLFGHEGGSIPNTPVEEAT